MNAFDLVIRARFDPQDGRAGLNRATPSSLSFSQKGHVNTAFIGSGTNAIAVRAVIATAGHLPDNNEKAPKFFSVNSALGLGTMKITSVNVDNRTTQGSFTIFQDGVEASGVFEYKGR